MLSPEPPHDEEDQVLNPPNDLLLHRSSSLTLINYQRQSRVSTPELHGKSIFSITLNKMIST